MYVDDEEPEEWTPEGLVEHFVDVHHKNHDRRFAFVLGAGASVQSGIPAASALARRWLGVLHRRLDRSRRPIEQWATAETLGIPGFSYDDAAAAYSHVFARRFRQHPDEGYAALESIMQGKDPSFGYSVLAHLLAETRHKLVITTNFDNLVADALSIFTATSPLVCGHESLAGFIRVVPRRPVVVKIHRDLLMAPMNLADEIAALPEPWHEPLTHVFRNYTPVVLGYGGNDGSLMGFLDNLPPRSILGGIFWCYYAPDGRPSQEICRLVARHHGAIIAIEGFDEFMAILSAQLRIGLLDTVIESKARDRVERYRRRAEELFLVPPREDAETRDLSSHGISAESGDSSSTQRQMMSPPDDYAHVSGAASSDAPTSVSRELPSSASAPGMASPTADIDTAGSAVLPRILLEPASTAREDGSSLDADHSEKSAPARSTTLQWALQQIAIDTPEASAWSALMQARSEPDHERSLALFHAAIERFPDDSELLAGIVERLCVIRTPANMAEATHYLRRLVEIDDGDVAARRDLALVHAWREQLPEAISQLRDAWLLVVPSPGHPVRTTHAATLALATGLVACLSHRDDTAALAIFRSSFDRYDPKCVMPREVLRDLMRRLEPSNELLYSRLLASLTLHGRHVLKFIGHIEPRLAEITPADLTNIDPLALI